MVPDYTSIAAAILLGIAGQNALKSAANGSATVIAQFLNPLTIIGLAILSSRPSKRFQSQSPSLGATRSSHILWNEPLGWPQMAGIVMIGGGVLLVRQH
jgi:drug/metabolite transporter (DMT)-like permease